MGDHSGRTGTREKRVFRITISNKPFATLAEGRSDREAQRNGDDKGTEREEGSVCVVF